MHQEFGLTLRELSGEWLPHLPSLLPHELHSCWRQLEKKALAELPKLKALVGLAEGHLLVSDDFFPLLEKYEEP